MNLQTLNTLSELDAQERFLGCCGTAWWAQQMAACRPFQNTPQLHDTADAIFDQMAEGHWLEAFAAHPKIGDVDSLRMKFAGNKQWSAGEQAGVDNADEGVLAELADANDAYEKRFGYIFIICASGLTADQMLGSLNQRLRHDPMAEAPIAAGEQRKITHLRLDKLMVDED
ncbi:2-oxo-4-hydroxy-4-carboxy-5-ureidoimidazoline decarboxylase [Algisphaera agarilytica]|uniref:2-oxo-4-hydroxy-4-carboxy-5-ureidoimidazoline decarboxylase n=1 Tax=Algisphaera agarilytica TaxID=1385975 RepID=A0A7X0H5E3_9BACT|nr:2-oxo-4-hydroxy-4-carboxy-5-ureidoimidazoline decarboxylase [Algisphaera agarilytica]MBB6429575.1 OHCU decarboxylase [Algisphaera agarilytica]